MTVGPDSARAFKVEGVFGSPLQTQAVRLQEETGRLVDLFHQQDRQIQLVTQWPATLSGFRALHPTALAQPVESFDMLLGPVSMGPRAILDALPHILSMLQELAGSGMVVDVEAQYNLARRDRLELRFEYRPSGGESVIAVTCRLVTSPTSPRPASFAINGFEAVRGIRLPEYEMYLECPVEAEPRRVDIEDPLRIWVQSFIDEIDDGRWRQRKSDHRQCLVESVVHLDTLCSALTEDDRHSEGNYP